MFQLIRIVGITSVVLVGMLPAKTTKDGIFTTSMSQASVKKQHIDTRIAKIHPVQKTIPTLTIIRKSTLKKQNTFFLEDIEGDDNVYIEPEIVYLEDDIPELLVINQPRELPVVLKKDDVVFEEVASIDPVVEQQHLITNDIPMQKMKEVHQEVAQHIETIVSAKSENIDIESEMVTLQEDEAVSEPVEAEETIVNQPVIDQPIIEESVIEDVDVERENINIEPDMVGIKKEIDATMPYVDENQNSVSEDTAISQTNDAPLATFDKQYTLKESLQSYRSLYAGDKRLYIKNRQIYKQRIITLLSRFEKYDIQEIMGAFEAIESGEVGKIEALQILDEMGKEAH